MDSGAVWCVLEYSCSDCVLKNSLKINILWIKIFIIASSYTFAMRLFIKQNMAQYIQSSRKFFSKTSYN